ncbi:MAG: type II secretion system F family protein [bacterium]|nr:type II secretion system F family protein [bacterium]MDZ4296640.1 type II secretion system F family protein [Patescibacteria group bacterium]
MFRLFSAAIKPKELVFATRHLALMIKAGVALTRALEILAGEASPRFKDIVLDLADRIRRGEPLSRALEAHPQFSPLYVSMVRSAEATGSLDEVLRTLALQLERDTELRGKVRGALMYPAVIVVAMVGIGILMLVMVVPKLAESFQELEVALPATTQMIIATSVFMRDWWFLLPLIAIAFVPAFRAVFRQERGRRFLSLLIIRIPVAKTLVQKLQTARFARTLSSLLDGGVAMLEALDITRGVLQNRLYKESLDAIAGRVEKGDSLATAMTGFERIYPTMIRQMVIVGEETGSLIEILRHLAEFYENEVTETAKNLSTLIEPLLMVLVGAAVGFFAISMMQPMYGLLNAI